MVGFAALTPPYKLSSHHQIGQPFGTDRRALLTLDLDDAAAAKGDPIVTRRDVNERRTQASHHSARRDPGTKWLNSSPGHTLNHSSKELHHPSRLLLLERSTLLRLSTLLLLLLQLFNRACMTQIGCGL